MLIYLEEFIYKTAYLLAVLLIVPIWAYIYVKHSHSRKEMLIIGIEFGIAAVLIAKFFALKDYWSPPYIFGAAYNIEDFLYGFFFTGIACEIYETCTNKRDSLPIFSRHFLLFTTFAVFSVFCFLIIVNILKFNSIWAHIFPPLLIGIFIVFIRKDLFKPALLSGMIVTILTVAWYMIILTIIPSAIQRFWFTDQLSKVYFLHIPVEELIFAFVLGFGVSNLYEFTTGRKLINNEKTLP